MPFDWSWILASYGTAQKSRALSPEDAAFSLVRGTSLRRQRVVAGLDRRNSAAEHGHLPVDLVGVDLG